MRKILVVVAVVVVLGLVAVVLLLSRQNTSPVAETDPADDVLATCTLEAMICPDGTAVGREGENCEFAACSVMDVTPEPMPGGVESGQIDPVTEGTAQLGKTITLNAVQVVPIEIVSDSRCPEGVECIWAGTVVLKVMLANQQASGEYTMTLGEAISFADKQITFTTVSPEKTQVADDDLAAYQFTFTVNK